MYRARHPIHRAAITVNKPFEPSRAFCYSFARNQALPQILMLPAVASGSPFRLADLAKPILDEHLTSEQQATMVTVGGSGRQVSVLQSVKHFVQQVAKNTGALISLGNGLFRAPTPADVSEDDLADADLEEAVLEGDDAEADAYDGHVYAFSFPALIKVGAPFPIKVGKATGDVDKRVEVQCKGSATFDNPVILGRWQVKRVGAVESAIHKVLQSRGKWRENAPGTEWFDTTIEEIQSIVTFIEN